MRSAPVGFVLQVTPVETLEIAQRTGYMRQSAQASYALSYPDAAQWGLAANRHPARYGGYWANDGPRYTAAGPGPIYRFTAPRKPKYQTGWYQAP